jgi:glycosyltransferase involved in cell wall biosynthesis
MKIAQIVAPGASEYERKSQRVDFAALSQAGHQVGVYDDADVAHIYGARSRGLAVARSRGVVINAELTLPEAVEEPYWSTNYEPRTTNLIGTFSRKALQNIIEQTHARLSRTRDDIEWRLFERPPWPEELAQIAVWVDPALTDDDKDGFVAEALVSGLVSGNVVVAARTTINVGRLEKGRTGFLVPPNDPNELTHAILAALFKPELGLEKLAAARQTISKFRPRQRLRALLPIYESLLR